MPTGYNKDGTHNGVQTRFKKGDNLGNTNGFKKGMTPWNKDRKETRQEVLEKIRLGHIGIKPTIKQLEALAIARHKGHKPSEATKEKQRISRNLYLKNNPDKRFNKGSFKKGRPSWCKGTKGVIISWNKGKGKIKSNCPLCGKKLAKFKSKLCKSCSKKGDKNPYWKDGISNESDLIRHSKEYKNWVKICLARDNFTDQKTGDRGGRLQVHHIYNFAQYPELRFDLKNGITFSEQSHDDFHKKYGIKNNNLNQVIEFINENHTLHNNRFISGFIANPSQGRGE